MPSKKIRKAEYETLARFRYSLRRFLHFSENAANEAGITPQHHQALLAIKGFPERDHVTVGELAERLQIRHNSAVGLVDRLAAEHLVLREPSGKDHRAVNVRLSTRGESMLEALTEAHREQLRRIGPELSNLLEKLGKE